MKTILILFLTNILPTDRMHTNHNLIAPSIGGGGGGGIGLCINTVVRKCSSRRSQAHTKQCLVPPTWRRDDVNAS